MDLKGEPLHPKKASSTHWKVFDSSVMIPAACRVSVTGFALQYFKLKHNVIEGYFG